MGKPKTVVFGNISMRLSTCGGFVEALMPKKDLESLVRVLGEVTQNVMDWCFEESVLPLKAISTSPSKLTFFMVICSVVAHIKRIQANPTKIHVCTNLTSTTSTSDA